MYKDTRYGITNIIHNDSGSLDISWDYDDDVDDISQRVPVMLYTPNDRRNSHYHITLNKEQAATLHTWLGNYLKEQETV